MEVNEGVKSEGKITGDDTNIIGTIIMEWSYHIKILSLRTEDGDRWCNFVKKIMKFWILFKSIEIIDLWLSIKLSRKTRTVNERKLLHKRRVNISFVGTMMDACIKYVLTVTVIYCSWKRADLKSTAIRTCLIVCPQLTGLSGVLCREKFLRYEEWKF